MAAARAANVAGSRLGEDHLQNSNPDRGSPVNSASMSQNNIRELHCGSASAPFKF
jgi:hypothetical protein